MAVTIRIAVEDIAERLAAGYLEISLESALTPTGSFSEVDTAPLIDVYYEIEDPAGTLTTWYRYRFTGASGAAPISAYTNPFNTTGATRASIRRQAITEYDAGLGDLLAVSGSSTTAAKFDYYQIASGVYQTGRGRGTWLYPQSGTLLGQSRIISNSVPEDGEFTVNPAWGSAPSVGTPFEWHWLAPVESWNLAINRAITRYRLIEQVPISGTGNHLPLTFLPWLKSRKQIYGIWHQASSNHLEIPYGTRGRWWGTRQEGASVVFLSSAPLDNVTGIYLEARRYADRLYTEGSVLDPALDLDCVAALAYDEVLAALSRPTVGVASSDRIIYLQARALHRPRLLQLASIFNPTPRIQLPQLHEPPVVPHLFRGGR